MGTEIPKQFLLLKGRPVLMHTIEAFNDIELAGMVLVLPASQMDRWQELCEEFDFRIKYDMVTGGETRFHSVKNGLSHIGDTGLVAIHDGVRPMIRKEIIEESFRVTALKGNAVASVRLKDSIRESKLTGGTRNLNRNNFYLIQTPQTFQRKILQDAYDFAKDNNIIATDDSFLAEQIGISPIIVEGSYENIKITTPDDLLLAELLLTRFIP